MTTENWEEAEIGSLLAQEFSGEWGEEPNNNVKANASVLRSTNIDNNGHIDYERGAKRRILTTSLASKKLLRDDILLEASGGGPNTPVGRVSFFRPTDAETYICSNFFRTLRVKKEFSSRFVFWKLLWFYNQPQIWNFQQQTTGIINLKTAEYLRSKITIPTCKNEQETIADILDTIDTAIQTAERLIAKQQDIRAGLLHDLLTYGLDTNGEPRAPLTHPEQFQESRLGLIPNEWEVVALECCLTGIDAGESPNCPDIPAAADEWGVLKVSAVKPEGFNVHENKVITNRKYIAPEYEVHQGDLLITRANTYELVGIVSLVKNPVSKLMLSDKTLRLKANAKKAEPEFLFYALQMPYVRFQIEINATGSSSTMKNISQYAIQKLNILRPSVDEQRLIVKLISNADEAIADQQAVYDKLVAEKKGLMDDLLTGRVRVSNVEMSEVTEQK